MEKSDKKRILTKILIVIAALTLLSCCFLGSTFARYVTSSSGSGEVNVAAWKITISGNGTGSNTASFATLSPDADNSGAGYTNTTDFILVAQIKNEGEVNASITFSASDQPIITLNSGVGSETVGYNQYYSEANTKAMFSIAFYSEQDDSATLASGTTLVAGDTMNIYAKVTWTTIDDATDTWYGTNAEKVSWTLNYTATQNSELPA